MANFLPVQIELQTLLENNLIATKDIGFVTSLAHRNGRLSEAQEWWAKHFVNNFIPGTYQLGPRPQRKSPPQVEVTQLPAEPEVNTDEFMKLIDDYLTGKAALIMDPNNQAMIDILTKVMTDDDWAEEYKGHTP